jgi:hypothetical protein
MNPETTWRKNMNLKFVSCIVLAPFAMVMPSLAVAAPSDACSLLTPAQVRAVLGVTVGPAERLVASSPNMCGFGGAGNPKRVVVALLTLAIFTHEKTPLKGISEETISGIGDEAHFITTPGFGTGLSVKKGGFAFKVRVYGFPPDQIREKEKTLAQQVLARL